MSDEIRWKPLRLSSASEYSMEILQAWMPDLPVSQLVPGEYGWRIVSEEVERIAKDEMIRRGIRGFLPRPAGGMS